jgi:tetratricopeptide (TPR) repeat protein
MARSTLRTPRRGRAQAAVLLFVAAWVASCQLPGATALPGEPLRLSQRAAAGDPARRASMRLVLSGLDSDEAGRSAEASSLYERALQVDPTNPYAWLALARQEVFEGDPDRGLANLDKAETLLASDDAAAAHLAGIRAAGLRALGQPELAAPFQREARERAPAAWADGKLDAAELR